MQTDRYTRVVLTIIAAALVANLAKDWLVLPEAHAGDGVMHCKIDDEVRIAGKVEIDTFSKNVQVDIAHPVELRPIELRPVELRQPVQVHTDH